MCAQALAFCAHNNNNRKQNFEFLILRKSTKVNILRATAPNMFQNGSVNKIIHHGTELRLS